MSCYIIHRTICPLCMGRYPDMGAGETRAAGDAGAVTSWLQHDLLSACLRWLIGDLGDCNTTSYLRELQAPGGAYPSWILSRGPWRAWCAGRLRTRALPPSPPLRSDSTPTPPRYHIYYSRINSLLRSPCALIYITILLLGAAAMPLRRLRTHVDAHRASGCPWQNQPTNFQKTKKDASLYES
jgi:hypothetical protein